MKQAAFFLIFLFSFTYCRNDESVKKMLIGKWQGKSWVMGNEIVGNPQAVTFEFKEGGTYSARFEGQKEQGNFRVLDNMLYTTANESNKIEKMVRIDVITPDSFVMAMNRSGSPEKLTLIKSN